MIQGQTLTYPDYFVVKTERGLIARVTMNCDVVMSSELAGPAIKREVYRQAEICRELRDFENQTN
jgi:hypothetical protein